MSEINETPGITFTSKIDMKLLLSFTRHGIKKYEESLHIETDSGLINNYVDKIARAKAMEMALISKINRIELVEES